MTFENTLIMTLGVFGLSLCLFGLWETIKK